MNSDVKLNGDGRLGGGSYGNVTINGAGVIGDTIHAETVKINGAGTAKGEVEARSIIVNGAATFDGALKAGELIVNGTATADSNLTADKIRIKGTLKALGSISAGRIDLTGMLSVGKDCQAEEITGKAGFDIDGMLNAGTIDLKIYGHCTATEIGGERIIIRRSIDYFGFSWILPEKRLTAGNIEADEVSLVFTTAKAVRGHNITLGEGCVIDLVEYSGTLTRDAKAQVKEVRKLEGRA